MARGKDGAETPLMKQYYGIKSQYPDAILLFRVGDFYETFGEDAVKTSKVLGIVLTRRANGAAAYVELAGFPHHSLDAYLPKLVRAGYRVAICDQLEDPKMTKTIVKRDVVEVITPGVTFNDKLLDQKTNNYLGSLILEQNQAGFAFTDASTGEFFTWQGPSSQLNSLLEMIQPKEVIIPKRLRSEFSFSRKSVVTERDDWIFTLQHGKDELIRHFKVHSLKSFDLESLDLATQAAGAIIHYLYENQKDNLGHIRRLSVYHPDEFMVLDQSTKRNLELITSMQGDGQKYGTLISILDETETPMGGRLLKKWIFQPLKVVAPINERLEAVSEFHSGTQLCEKVRSQISGFVDLERLAAKISMGKVSPRELVMLKSSLKELPLIKKTLEDCKSELLLNLRNQISELPEVVSLIDTTLIDDPPALLNEGGLIRDGFNSELDELRDMAKNGKTWMSALQQSERERTGISSLKINFNNVFGYYIEITRTNFDKIPDNYIRKQTLANAERFITPELKETEEKLLHAEEKLIALEQQLFLELRQKVAESVVSIQTNAQVIAQLDCLANFAHVARHRNYSKPVVSDDDVLDIRDGRHPVIEHLLPPGEDYVPNDVFLSSQTDQILIITGPNMSGKSSYLRQAGLITLLAQTGSFVPASSAKIGIVDRIFTRVGASDNLAAGESTFLVEMNETAAILNNATGKSLILLDEIGRGTSTYDGLSIAWSLCEYLHEAPGTRARTLFATHYHELNELAATFPRIRNFNVEVREYGDKVIFLRKIIPGGADHSYGIQVAQMAGLPDELILRAKTILEELEKGSFLADQEGKPTKAKPRQDTDGGFQMTMFEIQEAPIVQALLKLDINRMAPVEALLKLSELTSMARAAMKKGK